VQTIECLLLEPVGCLAEFSAGPFHEIAVRYFGRKGKASQSGSRSYWHLLNLMQAAETPLDHEGRNVVEALETEAVAGASIYEDVLPVLAELRSMGIRLFVATSLSRVAAMSFVERCVSMELAQNGVRREIVPDEPGGARRTLCASEELARTTEPSLDTACSAGWSRVPGGSGVRAGPVRVSEELAQNGARREIVPDESGGARRTLCAVDEFFSGVWTRDDAAGVRSAPLLAALAGASLPAEAAMFLTDTVEGIKAARSAGVHPVLMMNDPDEARRLAMHNPAGGVVSLHEMPDFIRLIAAQNNLAANH
jgi:beta-phosphoglucomutase-like phosphatase (HAD superfamily)